MDTAQGMLTIMIIFYNGLIGKFYITTTGSYKQKGA